MGYFGTDGPLKRKRIGIFPEEISDDRIVPIIGTLPIGVGMIGFFLPSFIYVIEAFGFYAASAIASLTFFRSLGGTFLPLAGPPLYDNLGLGYILLVAGLTIDGAIHCLDLSRSC